MAERKSTILIERGLIGRAGEIAGAHLPSKTCAIISDDTVRATCASLRTWRNR